MLPERHDGETYRCEFFPSLPGPAGAFRAWASVEKMARHLVEHGHESNAYVAVATFPAGGADRHAGSALRVAALWADLDVGEGKPHADKAAALARLKSFALAPSALVDSGGGIQPWWVLAEATDDVARVVRLVRGLARALDGDPAVALGSQVMRVPGSWNLKTKYGEPRPVELLELNANRYTLDDFPEAGVEEVGAAEHQRERRNADDSRPVERNVHLTSVAGSMRRRGMGQAAIEAALLVENRERFDPPLDEAEVLGIARSVARYEPADVGVDRPLTDAGQAELFADLNAGRLRYLHPLSEWRIFDQTQHRYRRDVDGEVDRLALEAARHRLKHAADIPDKDARAAAVKFALGNESQQRLDAVKRLARSTPALADAGLGWDADPYLLGTPSGVLDLRSGAQRDGHPDDRISMHAGTAYVPDAECPRWSRFLTEVFGDPAVIAYFQRWAGYCLTGDMSAQVFVLMHGRGANGKSVLLNVLRRVLGDYAINMPFSTFELRSERSALSPDMALLPGKRLVTSSETNDATRTNEARIKALTGADPITARPLYGKPFTFQPSAKLMFAVNVLPDVHDNSEAFWRRAHVLRFERQFLGAQMDPHLEEKLIEELPGILAWAVRGAIEYLDGGLRAPDQVLLGALEWRQAADPLAEFFASRCVIQDGAIARADGLYTAYRAWCAANGIADRDRMTGTRFGNAAGTRFTKKRDRLGTYYEGVGLRDDHHVDPPPVTGWNASNREIEPSSPAQPTTARASVTGSLNLGDGLRGTSDNFPSEMPREGELSGDPSNPSHPSHFAGRRIERWEP